MAQGIQSTLIGRHGSGLALSMAAGDCFLTSLWSRIHRKETLKPGGFLFFLFIQMRTQSALRINISILR